MADRIYSRELKCGCLISSDGGGGCMPCCYPGYDLYDSQEEEDELVKKCEEAWKKWKKTPDAKQYGRECIENNNSDKYLKQMIEEDTKIRKLFDETGGIPDYLGID